MWLATQINSTVYGDLDSDGHALQRSSKQCMYIHLVEFVLPECFGYRQSLSIQGQMPAEQEPHLPRLKNLQGTIANCFWKMWHTI